MVYVATSVALLCLSRLPAALAHARVSSPPIRSPGPAFLQACGQTSFNSVTQDPTGHIEEQEPVNAGCELTLCRGMLFKDQPSSNVLTVQASQAMEMNIDCTVPHGGPANVSLIDTTVGGSGAFIGSSLATFDDFCPTTGPTPADQTNLQYNLPNAATIGNKCQNPGECVVQLFWATPDFSQNYYYCVDVVMQNAAAAPSTVVTPAAPTAASVANAPAASPAVPATPSKMVTSAASAATGQVVGSDNSTSPVNATNASAARRRARILWF